MADKREATRRHIVEAAIALFHADGYEATTLDAIAEAAGISRRSFFAYFESKDDVILYWQGQSWLGLYHDLLATSPAVSPFDAVRDVMLKHAARYTVEAMEATDAIMRSSKSLLARKHAFHAQQEEALFATLCEVWREPERRPLLRTIAMVTVGAVRLSVHAWFTQTRKRRAVSHFLRAEFERLEAGF